MRLMQDWRVWMALLAAASLLLAGAVAFATGGFPGSAEQPTLPSVVTRRPIEPAATAIAPAVDASSTPHIASSAGGTASVAATPAHTPVPRPVVTPSHPRTTRTPHATPPATKPAPAPSPTTPKTKEPEREVVTPRVREEEAEHEGDRSSSTVSSHSRELLGGAVAQAASEPAGDAHQAGRVRAGHPLPQDRRGMKRADSAR